MWFVAKLAGAVWRARLDGAGCAVKATPCEWRYAASEWAVPVYSGCVSRFRTRGRFRSGSHKARGSFFFISNPARSSFQSTRALSLSRTRLGAHSTPAATQRLCVGLERGGGGGGGGGRGGFFSLFFFFEKKTKGSRARALAKTRRSGAGFLVSCCAF